MAEALAALPQSTHPDLLVGYNKADDAGVFRISDHQALVQTVDFFPPIVDDAYQFGQIAAANALSDVYAMGGTPMTALSIIGFPSSLPGWVLHDVLKGGSDKVEEAGAVIVGGHSIQDKELKYGIAVTGLIDPARIVTNSSARAGDRLFLSKKLGTGLITTGIKRQKVSEELESLVTAQMAELNRKPAELMLMHKVAAATDITGYGLLGHAFELAVASEKTIRIFSANLPLLPQALELAEQLMIPGGAIANRDFLAGKVLFDNDIDQNLEHVLYDPQTSGGLFMAIPESCANSFVNDAHKLGIDIWLVGQVEPKDTFPLIVE